MSTCALSIKRISQKQRDQSTKIMGLFVTPFLWNSGELSIINHFQTTVNLKLFFNNQILKLQQQIKFLLYNNNPTMHNNRLIYIFSNPIQPEFTTAKKSELPIFWQGGIFAHCVVIAKHTVQKTTTTTKGSYCSKGTFQILNFCRSTDK